MPSDFFQNYDVSPFTETAVSVRWNWFKYTEYTLNLEPPASCPSIAQLVERWTVVACCLLPIGRRFKSGSKEYSILHHETFSEKFGIVQNRCFFCPEDSRTPVLQGRTSAGKARRLWNRILARSRGRVVKATDSKSVSLWERRFESYRLRNTIRWRYPSGFFTGEKWSSTTYVTTMHLDSMPFISA